MNIRKAEEEDISQLTLLKEPKTPEYREKFHQNQLDRLQMAEEGKAVYLVVEENREIVGQVLLKLEGGKKIKDMPQINDLYVKESFRGKGIGTKLIQVAEEKAREKSFAKISLAVNPTLNPKVKKLYEDLGYKEIGEEYVDDVYDGVEDRVVDMVKML